jgi:transposase
MAIVQTLSSEIGKIVEKRHEMILAHEKFGVGIKKITEEYSISIGTYYYWYNRYLKEGLLGLVDKKPGAIVPYNKTPQDIETAIKQIALDNKELDSNEIYAIVAERYGYNKTVRTIENILQKHHLNRRRGRRSKKTMERKRAIQAQQQRLKM